MSISHDPIFQAGFSQGLEAAAALLEGRASMAVELRQIVQGEALELAARQVRSLLPAETQGGNQHG